MPFADKIYALPPGAQLRSHGLFSGGTIGSTPIAASATVNCQPNNNLNPYLPALDCHQAGIVFMEADITQGATAGAFTLQWSFGATPPPGWIYIGQNVYAFPSLAAGARQLFFCWATIGTLGTSTNGTPATHVDAPFLPVPASTTLGAFQIINNGAGAATVNAASVFIVTTPIVINPNTDNAPWT